MNVSRREIWLANLDPVLGAEIRKTRPVVVVNSDPLHKQRFPNFIDLRDSRNFYQRFTGL